MTLSNFVFYCWNLQRSLALKNGFDASRAPRFATHETVVQMLCNRCTTKNFLLGIHSTCHIIHTATGSNPARVKPPIWHAWREYVVAQWKVHVPQRCFKRPQSFAYDKCSEIDDVISYHFEVVHIISLGQFIVGRNFEIFNVLLLVDFNVLIKLGTFLWDVKFKLLWPRFLLLVKFQSRDLKNHCSSHLIDASKWEDQNCDDRRKLHLYRELIQWFCSSAVNAELLSAYSCYLQLQQLFTTKRGFPSDFPCSSETACLLN